MFSKRSPVGGTRSEVTDRFPGRRFEAGGRANTTPRERRLCEFDYPAKAAASRRTPKNLAMDKIAQKLFDAGALTGVLFLGDGTGLLAEFQAKDGLLERIEAGTDLGVHLSDAVCGCGSWSGASG